MRAVSEVLQAPDPVHVEKLFSRLPAIFNIVIFSPHGYFGQSDVLGLPDTGGQVRYCFDLAFIRSYSACLALRFRIPEVRF
jgi:sucrose synthase